MYKLSIVILFLLINFVSKAQSKLEEVPPTKRIINAFEVVKENAQQNRKYGVFMRIPSMSSGVYTLKVGDQDDQTPHTKDEIYYIMKGKAKLKVGTETYNVIEGSLVFVEAYKDHKFYDIEEDLAVLVVFGAEQKPTKKK